MLYSKNEINKVRDILEGDKACSLIDSLDNLISDDSLPSVSDMIDDALSNYSKKSMYISKAVFKRKGEDDKYGFAIEVENSKGDGYDVYAQYICKDSIPLKMLYTLMELSYMGYVLKTSKTMGTVEIDMYVETNK